MAIYAYGQLSSAPVLTLSARLRAVAVPFPAGETSCFFTFRLMRSVRKDTICPFRPREQGIL